MEAFEVETKVESSRESSQPEAQRSSLFSAYANTTSTILGAGTLAVPIAMSSAGVVSYALITIFVIMVNSQTATWLVRVADHLPKSEGNAGKNYEGIAKSYLGTRAAHLISLVFVFSGLSVGMSRMLFSVDCLAPLFATWLAEPERPTLKLIQRMERRVLWAAGFGLVLPLGLLRDISKLQCTSSLAVVSLGLTVAFIVYCNAEALHEHPHLGKGFQLVNIDSAFFLSLAMTNSSLSCHISVIPIYESLRGGDVKTMRNIILAALATSALVYQMVGFSSYLRFGHLTSGEASNILEVVTEQVNPHTEPMKFTLAAIAGASVASSLILGMPVVLWALRSVLLSYARFHVRSSRGANGEISQLEWSLATLGLMMTILVLATAVPDIQVAMSLGGSLGGTFISFMYPALFHLTVVKKVTNFREAFCPANLRELLVIAMSVVYGVLCLSISLRRVMSKLSEKDIELDASNSTSSEAWSSSVSIMW